MSVENTIVWMLLSLFVIIAILYIIMVATKPYLSYPSLDTTLNPSHAKLSYYYTVDMTNGASITVNGDLFTLYQSIYSPLYKNSGSQQTIGSYSSATSIQNVNYFLTCLSGNNPLSCAINTTTTKSGFAVLSITDNTLSGTITYVLNNNPAVSMTRSTNNFPVYFPNKAGDPNVYDIVGGTGSFLGKTGYVYIPVLPNSLRRVVYIYYK